MRAEIEDYLERISRKEDMEKSTLHHAHQPPTSDSIKVLVDVLWDGLDLGVQIVLDAEHVILVLFANEIDRQTQVAKSARTTDSMQVGVGLSWEVKVDDNVHRDDVYTTSENI